MEIRKRMGWFGEFTEKQGEGLAIRKGNENNVSKRKMFPEKSNPRVREEGHICLFRSLSAQCPSFAAVPRIYEPFTLFV